MNAFLKLVVIHFCHGVSKRDLKKHPGSENSLHSIKL